jgi:hypothetical protein
MRNVSNKSCRANQNKHFTLNNLFQNSAICEVIWKNAVDQGQATADNKAHAHCMIDA